MKVKKNSLLLIIVSVVLVMIFLFVGILFLMSSMGYIEFYRDFNENVTDEQQNDDIDNSIESNVEISKDIEKVLDEKITDVYNLFRGAPSRWCETDLGDGFMDGTYQYDLSTKFSSEEEVHNHLKKYISSYLIVKLENNFFDFNHNKTIDLYKEKDGKLYCYNPVKGSCNSIIEDEIIYKNFTLNDDLIFVSGKIGVGDCGVEGVSSYVNFEAQLRKFDNNWIVSDYEEDW